MKHQPTETSLREVFGDWTEALNAGRLDQFYEHLTTRPTSWTKITLGE